MRNTVIPSVALALCAPLAAQIQLQKIGNYETGIFDDSAAEIPAYDAGSQRLFVTNGADNAVDVLDLSDPTSPSLLFSIDLSSLGGGVNSVAVRSGLVAAAVEADDATDPGVVAFFDVDGNLLTSVGVGSLPDMLTFTPDGRYVLVANEGEPNDEYTVDPEGSVSVIDLRRGVARARVRTADFGAFHGATLDPSIRIFGPGASVAQDLEPEYIAVGPFGRFAWVSCQENNALALLDIRRARIVGLYGLGFKHHSLPGNELDASNRDGAINIRNWPVNGIYQPDAIAVTSFFGFPFILTANEGDARDYDGYSEEERIKDLVLDPTVFPDAATLQLDENLGRLNSTTATGDTDGDGDVDFLVSYGARSMSVFSPFGQLIWDSGSQLERITAADFPNDFNSTNDENGSFDARSDDKGPEPEGVTTGRIGFRTYAFLGLERMGGVAVYDVTFPWAPRFVSYTNARDFGGDAEAGTAGDLGPEGLLFIPASDSPNGQPLLIVTNEVSGNTSVFAVEKN